MQNITHIQKDRFSWALSVINPNASDRILEVGCGSGILVKQMATLLRKGSIIAVDKSEAMVRAAQKRNHAFCENDVVRFYRQDFASFDFKPHYFDKAIAFNVTAFWQSPEQLLSQIKNCLKPDGRFYLFNQPPYDKTKELALKAEAALRNHSFQIDNVLIEHLAPAPAFCIIANAS